MKSILGMLCFLGGALGFLYWEQSTNLNDLKEGTPFEITSSKKWGRPLWISLPKVKVDMTHKRPTLFAEGAPLDADLATKFFNIISKLRITKTFTELNPDALAKMFPKRPVSFSIKFERKLLVVTLGNPSPIGEEFYLKISEDKQEKFYLVKDLFPLEGVYFDRSRGGRSLKFKRLRAMLSLAPEAWTTKRPDELFNISSGSIERVRFQGAVHYDVSFGPLETGPRRPRGFKWSKSSPFTFFKKRPLEAKRVVKRPFKLGPALGEVQLIHAQGVTDLLLAQSERAGEFIVHAKGHEQGLLYDFKGFSQWMPALERWWSGGLIIGPGTSVEVSFEGGKKINFSLEDKGIRPIQGVNKKVPEMLRVEALVEFLSSGPKLVRKLSRYKKEAFEIDLRLGTKSLLMQLKGPKVLIRDEKQGWELVYAPNAPASYFQYDWYFNTPRTAQSSEGL